VLIPNVGATEQERLTLQEWKELQEVVNDFQLMAFLAWEIEEASEPYYKGNFEVAKYTLSHAAKILEFYAEQEASKITAGQDLAFVYVRLGKIAESEGNNHAKQEYFASGAVAYNNATNRSYSPEQLVALFDKLDANSQNMERQFPTFRDAIAPNQSLKGTKIDHAGD